MSVSGPFKVTMMVWQISSMDYVFLRKGSDGIWQVVGRQNKPYYD